MLKNSTVRMIAVVFVLMLASSFDALAANDGRRGGTKKTAAVQTRCSAKSDADLLMEIKAKLEADPEIKKQLRHLNISVSKRVVTLEGWLSGNGTIARAVAIVKKTKCVKRVISKLKTKGGLSCGPGQKPCGDICIDKNSDCNIGNDNPGQ